MKPIIKSAIATTALACMSILAMAANAHAGAKTCSNHTLSGSYGSTLTGTVNNLPFAAVNLVSSDGDGNTNGSGTIVYNGTVIPSAFTATYTINSDCSGSFVSSAGISESIVISRDGSLVHIIVAGLALGPAAVSGSAQSLGK